ncbi:hypothetical protein J3Q64DRAFT_1884349 [Phycomyces blakesleeanus]|uniref:Uncharacterized protein n=1 Tax=Phycomyces blakesleeanus TaxID=4837 RepID=A0ABR3B3C1_PHYBL
MPLDNYKKRSNSRGSPGRQLNEADLRADDESSHENNWKTPSNAEMQRSVVGNTHEIGLGEGVQEHAQTSGFTYGSEDIGSRVRQKTPVSGQYNIVPQDNNKDVLSHSTWSPHQHAEHDYASLGTYAYAKATEDPARDIVGDGLKDTLHGSHSPTIQSKSAIKQNAVTTDHFVRTPAINEAFSMAVRSSFLDLGHIVDVIKSSHAHDYTSDQAMKGVGFDVGKRLSGAGAAIGAAIGSVFHSPSHNSHPQTIEETPDVKIARNREAFTGQHQSVDSYDHNQGSRGGINRASFGAKSPDLDSSTQNEEMPSTWPDSSDPQKTFSQETRGISSVVSPSIKSSMGLDRGANLVRVNKERIKEKNSSHPPVAHVPDVSRKNAGKSDMSEKPMESPSSSFVEDEYGVTANDAYYDKLSTSADDWEDNHTSSETGADPYKPTSHLKPSLEHERHVATPDIPPLKMGRPAVGYAGDGLSNQTYSHGRNNLSASSNRNAFETDHNQQSYKYRDMSSHPVSSKSGLEHTSMPYNDRVNREQSAPGIIPQSAANHGLGNNNMSDRNAQAKFDTSHNMYSNITQQKQPRRSDMLSSGVHSDMSHKPKNEMPGMNNKPISSSSVSQPQDGRQGSYSNTKVSQATGMSSATDDRHASEGTISEAANYLTKLATSATAAIDSGIQATESAVKSLIKDTTTQETHDGTREATSMDDQSNAYHYGTKSGHQNPGPQELTTSFHNPRDVSTYGRTHNTLPEDNTFLPLTSKVNSRTKGPNFPNADQLAPTESERKHYHEQVDVRGSEPQNKGPPKKTVRLVYSEDTDSYVPASPEGNGSPIAGSTYTGASSVRHSHVEPNAQGGRNTGLSHPLSGFADTSKNSSYANNNSYKDGTTLGNSQSNSLSHRSNSSHLAKLAAGGAMTDTGIGASATNARPSAPPTSGYEGYNPAFSSSTGAFNSHRKSRGNYGIPKDDTRGLSTSDFYENEEPGFDEVMDISDISGQESRTGMYRNYNDDILSEPTESGDSNNTLPPSSRHTSPYDHDILVNSNQSEGAIVEDDIGADFRVNRLGQYEYETSSEDYEAEEGSFYDADNDESNDYMPYYGARKRTWSPRQSHRDQFVMEDSYNNRTPLNERVGEAVRRNSGYAGKSSSSFNSSQTTPQVSDNKRNMEYIAAGVAGAGFSATLKPGVKRNLYETRQTVPSHNKTTPNTGWPQGFTTKNGVRDGNILQKSEAIVPAKSGESNDHYPQLPSSSVHHNVHNVEAIKEKIIKNPANNDDVRPYDPGNNESNEDVSSNSFGAVFRSFFRKSTDQNMPGETQQPQKHTSNNIREKEGELSHDSKRPLDETNSGELPPSYKAATRGRSTSYDAGLPSRLLEGSDLTSANELENMSRNRHSIQEIDGWKQDTEKTLKATEAQHNLDWRTVANFHGPVPERHDATGWLGASESLKEDRGVLGGCKKDSVYNNLFDEKMEDSDLAKGIKEKSTDMQSKENDTNGLEPPVNSRRSTLGATESTLTSVGATIGAAIRSALGRGPQEEKAKDIDAYGEPCNKSESNSSNTPPKLSQHTNTAYESNQKDDTSELLKKRDDGKFNLANQDGTPLETYDPVTGITHSNMRGMSTHGTSSTAPNIDMRKNKNNNQKEARITDRKEGLLTDHKKEGLITDHKEEGLLTDRKKEGLITDRKEEGLLTDRKERLITDPKGKGPMENHNDGMNVNKELPDVKDSKTDKISRKAAGASATVGAAIGARAASLRSNVKDAGNKATDKIKQTVQNTEKKLPGISTSDNESKMNSNGKSNSSEHNPEHSFHSARADVPPTPPAKDAESAYFDCTSPKPNDHKNEEKIGSQQRKPIVTEPLDLKAMREKHKRASMSKRVDNSTDQTKIASSIGKTLGAVVAGAGTAKTVNAALDKGHLKSQTIATNKNEMDARNPTDTSTGKNERKRSASWRKSTYYSGSKSPGACSGPGQGVWVNQTKNPLTCKKHIRSASTSSVPSDTHRTERVGSYVGAGTGIWDNHVDNPLTSKKHELEKKMETKKHTKNRRSCQN